MYKRQIDIKARSLVPPPDDGFDDYYDEDDDPQGDLIRALEEYQMIKEEAEKLKEMETVGYYFKEPDREVGGVQVKYKDFTLDALLAAFAKLMLKRESMKSETGAAREIPRDLYTVPEKISYIRAVSYTHLLCSHPSAPFPSILVRWYFPIRTYLKLWLSAKGLCSSWTESRRDLFRKERKS